jgi:O-acetyl-ADP-ribose deacetylase (regulator of RNase III)
MTLNIIREDIAKLDVDIIVDPTNRDMIPEAGACRHIFEAAGKEQLISECAKIGELGYGEIAVTSAGRLPAGKIIHTVGPVWRDGRKGEEIILMACYMKALDYAASVKAESIAFPLISTGHRDYPRQKALQAAVDTIREFLTDHEMTVYLVVYDDEAFRISQELYDSVEVYLKDNYIGDEEDICQRTPDDCNVREITEQLGAGQSVEAGGAVPYTVKKSAQLTRKDIEAKLDETFSERLLRYITERDLKDADVYNRANIDRRLFSKIRSHKDYRPTKYTAMAFVIALELNMDDAADLLQSAGYAFTNSSRFDIIIQYFISHGEYDVFRINEVLYSFGQHMLGA